ncbi:hypothetical protein COA17_08430 [Sphingomonas ginsenosidimutans]|uniref:DUF1993 domain-containing protein n=2 Tax=Sphingomonas ginsenosidimutans TaxID=862134 RepID=A0A2A4HY82_9SPHN|nr:DUF1993 domain-containing protein [Pseudomonadota bacterium]PCG09304.1 hypothetical protein COA17_08430 [Sphingomonas ginsenosidimutans]
MTLSLYEALVPSMLQTLGAVDGLLTKAEAYAAEHGLAPSELIDARLAPDMAPLGYQVKACREHSLAAIAGVRDGHFTPSRAPWPTDFAGLHALLAEATGALTALDAAEMDALAAAPVDFVMGEMRLPFTGTTFLLSFSQPNFYFHATTAYAILRMKGLPLGKTDFLGRLRLGR